MSQNKRYKLQIQTISNYQIQKVKQNNKQV
jgi:hypothetical protein